MNAEEAWGSRVIVVDWGYLFSFKNMNVFCQVSKVFVIIIATTNIWVLVMYQAWC